MAEGVGAWLDAAARHPLLTPAEELHLGAMVREWQDWPGGPDAAPAGVRRRGLRARERMANANLRLVMTVAKRFAPVVQRRGLQLEDGLQEGVIGLMRGVEKFDPQAGYKFSTYAYWWIRQGIGRWVNCQSGLVRLPAGVMEQLAKLGPAELQALPKAQRERMVAAIESQRMSRLDGPVISGEGEGTTLGEMVASPADDPLEALDWAMELERLRDWAPEEVALLELVAVQGHKGAAQVRGETLGRVKIAAERARQRLRMAA